MAMPRVASIAWRRRNAGDRPTCFTACRLSNGHACDLQVLAPVTARAPVDEHGAILARRCNCCHTYLTNNYLIYKILCPILPMAWISLTVRVVNDGHSDAARRLRVRAIHLA